MPPDTSDLAGFREQCRRQLQRSLEDRIRYGFCRIYKPVLDDAPYRVFDSMEEYRQWWITSSSGRHSSSANGRRIIGALRSLGFEIDELSRAIERGPRPL